MKALIINGNGHDLRVVPVFDWFRPTFHIGLTITHHRHTAGFYYGVPWHAANKYNGHDFRVVPVFDWFRPTFHIGLTLLTPAIRRGSITACHGAPLHVLMCFVWAMACLAQFGTTYRIYHAVMYINYWIPIL